MSPSTSFTRKHNPGPKTHDANSFPRDVHPTAPPLAPGKLSCELPSCLLLLARDSRDEKRPTHRAPARELELEYVGGIRAKLSPLRCEKNIRVNSPISNRRPLDHRGATGRPQQSRCSWTGSVEPAAHTRSTLPREHTHTPTSEVPRRTSSVRNLRRPWAPGVSTGPRGRRGCSPAAAAENGGLRYGPLTK